MLLSKSSHKFEAEKVPERTYSSLDQISEHVKQYNVFVILFCITKNYFILYFIYRDIKKGIINIIFLPLLYLILFSQQSRVLSQ